MNHLPAVRSADYLVLRLIFGSPQPEGVRLDFASFRDLVFRYLTIVERLEKFLARAFAEGCEPGDRAYGELGEAISVKKKLEPLVNYIKQFGVGDESEASFQRFISTSLGLRSFLEDLDLTEEKVRSKIDQATSESGSLIGRFVENAKKLSSAIGDIERNTVTLLYEESEADVVYDVHVSASSDEAVREAGRRIVGYLTKRTKAAIKDAFKELSELRTSHPLSPDTFVLSAKVYRAIRMYREALEYAKRASGVAPNYAEAHIEMGFCYRNIADSEGHDNLLLQAWHCIKRAAAIDEDARVLRELTYLIWLSMNDRWQLPKGEIGSPVEYLSETSKRALELARERYGNEAQLTITLMNDLAFYLAMRGRDSDLSEAEELINGALSHVSKLSKRDIASYWDTKGFILLQRVERRLCEEGQRREILREASRLIMAALEVNPKSGPRRAHLASCMQNALEFGLL